MFWTCDFSVELRDGGPRWALSSWIGRSRGLHTSAIPSGLRSRHLSRTSELHIGQL